jgi:hypothetical protein
MQLRLAMRSLLLAAAAVANVSAQQVIADVSDCNNGRCSFDASALVALGDANVIQISVSADGTPITCTPGAKGMTAANEWYEKQE